MEHMFRTWHLLLYIWITCTGVIGNCSYEILDDKNFQCMNDTDYDEATCRNVECFTKCMEVALTRCNELDEFYNEDPLVFRVFQRAKCLNNNVHSAAGALCQQIINPCSETEQSRLKEIFWVRSRVYRQENFEEYKNVSCEMHALLKRCNVFVPGGDCTVELAGYRNEIQKMQNTLSACNDPQNSTIFVSFGYDLSCENNRDSDVSTPDLTTRLKSTEITTTAFNYVNHTMHAPGGNRDDNQTTHAPNGNQTTHAPNGILTTHAPNDNQTTHAPNGNQTTHAPNGILTTHAPNGILTTHAPNGNQTTQAPNGNQTTQAPNDNQTSQAPNGNQTTNDPNDNQTTHVLNGNQTTHAPNGNQTSHHPDDNQTTHAPNGIHTTQAPNDILTSQTIETLTTTMASLSTSYVLDATTRPLMTFTEAPNMPTRCLRPLLSKLFGDSNCQPNPIMDSIEQIVDFCNKRIECNLACYDAIVEDCDRYDLRLSKITRRLVYRLICNLTANGQLKELYDLNSECYFTPCYELYNTFIGNVADIEEYCRLMDEVEACRVFYVTDLCPAFLADRFQLIYIAYRDVCRPETRYYYEEFRNDTYACGNASRKWAYLWLETCLALLTVFTCAALNERYYFFI